MDNPVALPCEKPHFFCVECLSNLEKAIASHTNVPCPTCRKEYNHATLTSLLNRNEAEVEKILDKGLNVNFKHRITFQVPWIRPMAPW